MSSLRPVKFITRGDLPNTLRRGKGSLLLSQALQRDAARHGSVAADRHVPDHPSRPSLRRPGRQGAAGPGACLPPVSEDPSLRKTEASLVAEGEILGGSVKIFALCPSGPSMSSRSTNIRAAGFGDWVINYLQSKENSPPSCHLLSRDRGMPLLP